MLFLAHLHVGDHLVAFTDGYCETGTFIAEELPRFGVRSSFIAADDPESSRRAVMSPETRMVYVETIANPTLRLADLKALARVTHSPWRAVVRRQHVCHAAALQAPRARGRYRVAQRDQVPGRPP